MMTETTQKKAILIDERPFEINCPQDQLQALQESADYLNQKITEVRKKYGALSLEKIAIITALNFAHDALHQEKVIDQLIESTSKIQESSI